MKESQRRANRWADPEPIGRLLSAVLKELGLETRVLERQAAMLWEEVVDKRLAQISSVTGIEGGKLFVYIEGSVWKDHFKHLKRGIIDQINQKMGKQVIREIVLSRKRGF